MTRDDFQRLERMIEGSFGALTDWLELVRAHENERRARALAAARARRDLRTRVVMAVLSAGAVAAFWWWSQRA